MGGVWLDAGHTLFVGQLFAPFIYLLRQMGNIEEVHIFKAVGLPELGLFGEHVLLGGGVKIHRGGQGVLVLFAAGHIIAAGVHIAQTVDGFLSGHSGSSLFITIS